jgi:hypothetical protein
MTGATVSTAVSIAELRSEPDTSSSGWVGMCRSVAFTLARSEASQP